MTINIITPTKGDVVVLLDGNGNPTENFTIVEAVFIPYQEGYYEVEDADGERYLIGRYPEMDSDMTYGWIEIVLDEE